ncbi:MAG: hypothetical protein B7Y35_09390 [Sphingomonadales bacterium 28-64-96]|nr:MAG: hypothetical protein B7Y35_09390 [Sphingomonadales bacterium 28-64-96]
MQLDGQMMILAHTNDLAATLALIDRHGAASATLSVQRYGHEMALELLCPPHVGRDAALAIGGELANAPMCREVTIKLLRRVDEGRPGAGYRLEELASWAPIHDWRAAA